MPIPKILFFLEHSVFAAISRDQPHQVGRTIVSRRGDLKSLSISQQAQILPHAKPRAPTRNRLTAKSPAINCSILPRRASRARVRAASVFRE
jgi:hypothetical protein